MTMLKVRPAILLPPLGVALVLVVPAAIIAAVYLSSIAANDYATPIGFDAPKYVWRSNLVAGEGLVALSGSAPEPFRVNADRPGFPVLASLFTSLLDVSTIRYTVVLPALLAVCVGLAGGGLATLGLREGRLAFVVFAVVVGASVNVSRMAGPAYQDNLLLAPLVVGAIALAVSASGERGGSPGSIVLLSAGWLIHWVFVALVAGLLVCAALVLAPGSFRTWRRTGGALRTPSGRLVSVAGGASLLGGLGLLGLASGEPSPPRLPRENFLGKLRADVPRYAFPLMVPVAAVGAAWLAAARDPDQRRGLAVLGVWALSGVGGVVLLMMGAAVPAHRFLAFALGLPALVAAGLVGIARVLKSRPGSAGRFAGAVLLLVGVVAAVVLGYRGWYRAHPWMSRTQLSQAASAGAYLDQVGGDRPAVFLIDMGGRSPLSSTSLAFHVIRAGLPAVLIPRTLVYLGEPERFLMGEPTLRSEPSTFDRASLRHWPTVEVILDEDPIALMMPAFNRSFDRAVQQHPEWQAGPDLAVVQGPPPSGAPLTAPGPPEAMTVVELAALTAALLAVLIVVGGGWSALLVPGGWLERLALGPAFGIATLVVTGVVASRLEAPLDRPTAIFLVLGVTGIGWAAAATGGSFRPRIPGSRMGGS